MGTGEVPAVYKEKLLTNKDSEEVEQVALRGCVTSVLRFRPLTRPSCEEPRASPALGMGLD